jgi:hypothetical protein
MSRTPEPPKVRKTKALHSEVFCKNALRFAESGPPLWEEGKFAKPLSGLPRGAGRGAKLPKTYTAPYTYTEIGHKVQVISVTCDRHHLTQNQVAARSCWFESGQGHQSAFCRQRAFRSSSLATATWRPKNLAFARSFNRPAALAYCRNTLSPSAPRWRDSPPPVHPSARVRTTPRSDLRHRGCRPRRGAG